MTPSKFCERCGGALPDSLYWGLCESCRQATTWRWCEGFSYYIANEGESFYPNGLEAGPVMVVGPPDKDDGAVVFAFLDHKEKPYWRGLWEAIRGRRYRAVVKITPPDHRRLVVAIMGYGEAYRQRKDMELTFAD